MTVQQAFAELIGRENNLARYQVGPLVITFANLGPSHASLSVTPTSND